MSTIYWILFLSKLGLVFEVIGVIITVIASLIWLFTSMLLVDDDSSTDKGVKFEIKLNRRSFKFLVCGIIAIIASLFIPRKQEFAIIYGLGTIKEYMETSEEIKKLPDNVVKVINNELEELLRDEKE